MTVSLQDVERVAELANLELTSGEKTEMLRTLNSVLDHFSELAQLDTSSIPPMSQIADQVIEEGLVQDPALTLRADEIAPSLKRERVLAAAPDTDGAFFKVPKVIER